MRITFVSSSLGCGGVERVLCSLSGALLQRGHSVTIITLSTREADFFSLPQGVTRVALNLIADVSSPTFLLRAVTTTRRLRALRQAILSTRPDVVRSVLQHVNVMTLLALAGTRCPIVISEHLDPTMISCGRPWDQLRRLTYRWATMLVSVSRGIDEGFAWLPQQRRIVIYNPLPLMEQTCEPEDVPGVLNDGANWVLAMGRLSRQKGFDLLLPAFARASAKNPQWRLMIIGEGDERPGLERLIESLGLRDRVVLPGRIRNPFPVLKQAKLFVLPSRHEGFGNVLIEAMACGVPVIATDCPSGPGEIVRDGENGLLVPTEDVNALAAALTRLMSDEAERARLGACGARAVEQFEIEKIADSWEDLLYQVVDKQKHGDTKKRFKADLSRL